MRRLSERRDHDMWEEATGRTGGRACEARERVTLEAAASAEASPALDQCRVQQEPRYLCQCASIIVFVH